MTDSKELVEVNTKKSWEEALEHESWIAPLIDICETSDDFSSQLKCRAFLKKMLKLNWKTVIL